MDFSITGELVDQVYSADFFDKTETKSLTELAQLLSTSFNIPFTVSFEKQDGKERILRGRLKSPEPLLGRSYVEDLDKKENRIRLVDHRHLNWMIVNGVKYVRK